MLAGIYLFARVLIVNILMKSKKTAGNQETAVINEIVTDNFMYISSVLYFIFMQEVDEMLKDYERDKNLKASDIYSKKLLPFSKVAPFFKSKAKGQKEFINEMRGIVRKWL